MASEANGQGLSLPEVERALEELNARQAELVRERSIYKRLGFATERLNIALGQVATRRERLHDLRLRLEGEHRAASGKIARPQTNPQLPR